MLVPTFRFLHVILALMPKGVEHNQTSLRVVKVASDPRVDAERR